MVYIVSVSHAGSVTALDQVPFEVKAASQTGYRR